MRWLRSCWRRRTASRRDAWDSLDVPRRPPRGGRGRGRASSPARRPAAVQRTATGATPWGPTWSGSRRVGGRSSPARDWPRQVSGGQGEYYRRADPRLRSRRHYAVAARRSAAELLGALSAGLRPSAPCWASSSTNTRALRRAEGLMLFSETPRLLLALLGDLEETARRLDSPVEHLLLDEFQDTSDPQWGVLRHFALPAAQAARLRLRRRRRQAGHLRLARRAGRDLRAHRRRGCRTWRRKPATSASAPPRSCWTPSTRSSRPCPAAPPLSRTRRGARPLARALSANTGRSGRCPAMSRCARRPRDGDHLSECAGRIAECVGRLPRTCSVGVLVAQERHGGCAGGPAARAWHRRQQRGQRRRRRRPGR